MIFKKQIRIILLDEFKMDGRVEAHQNIVNVCEPDGSSIRSTRLWFRKFQFEDIRLWGDPSRGRIPQLDYDHLKPL